MRVRILIAAAVLVPIAALSAGCATSGAHATAAARSASANAAPASGTPAPPGNGPSESAQMICAAEAQADIESALGMQVSQPVKPTWTDHVYSCRYVYPVGAMVLSVKELPDAASTTAYFASLQRKFTGSATVPGLGEGAFTASDGSTVVRKDFKVLTIDVSGLPPQFGEPAVVRTEAAYRVAVVIMGCWTGN